MKILNTRKETKMKKLIILLSVLMVTSVQAQEDDDAELIGIGLGMYENYSDRCQPLTETGKTLIGLVIKSTSNRELLKQGFGLGSRLAKRLSCVELREQLRDEEQKDPDVRFFHEEAFDGGLR